MARRLVIGGAGPGLTSEDESTGFPVRGELGKYAPPVPQDITRAPSQADVNAGKGAPFAVVMPEPTGGDATGETGPDSGAPPGAIADTGPVSGGEPGPDAPGDTSGGAGTATGDTSTGGDPGGSPYAGGGKVGGASSEHPITAQEGEWVINRDAVKKYGDAFMQAINSGKALVTHGKAIDEHFASGGKVGSGSRFAALVAKLQAQGKSASAAKGIAAAAGRAKYGKGRFQAMAAKGRRLAS